MYMKRNGLRVHKNENFLAPILNLYYIIVVMVKYILRFCKIIILV